MKPPIYNTKRYTLKPYEKVDEERFIEISMDKEVIELMGGTRGIEEEERKLFSKIFEIYNSDNKERWFWVWGIYKNDLLCAHLELKETKDTLNNELEIVYMVHPKERNKGLISEVLLFLKSIQSSLNKKIIATVDPQNTKSLKVLKKWGIEKEEILHDSEDNNSYLKITLK